MSIRTTITPRLCNQTNCIGGIYPFFRRKSKSIKTCLFFKPLEFEGFKKEAGLNAFTLSPKKWIDTTNAIGLIAKSGRYGGTYAHKDIAFSLSEFICAACINE